MDSDKDSYQIETQVFKGPLDLLLSLIERRKLFINDISLAQVADDFILYVQKIDNFPEYVLSPYSQIPPGDCIIIEFSEEKQTTEHICETYKVAVQRGELSGS